MKVLFAVSNDNITTSVVNKYQQRYKEIITTKSVYYFNAIVNELKRDKEYNAIVIEEDLEPISNNNYEKIDRFLSEKLDNISDEATRPTGEDIPIILICSDRRNKSDQLLRQLFSMSIYNALVGNDRSLDKVCDLMKKPRSKKDAKQYYEIETDQVEYEPHKDELVSEEQIQNILAYYRKIGTNEKKCVQAFERISKQYDNTQLRIIVKFLPIDVKAILEAYSPVYQKLMSKGTVLSNGKYTQYKTSNPKKPENLDFITKDVSEQATSLNKPVVIPSNMNIPANQMHESVNTNMTKPEYQNTEMQPNVRQEPRQQNERVNNVAQQPNNMPQQNNPYGQQQNLYGNGNYNMPYNNPYMNQQYVQNMYGMGQTPYPNNANFGNNGMGQQMPYYNQNMNQPYGQAEQPVMPNNAMQNNAMPNNTMPNSNIPSNQMQNSQDNMHAQNNMNINNNNNEPKAEENYVEFTGKEETEKMKQIQPSINEPMNATKKTEQNTNAPMDIMKQVEPLTPMKAIQDETQPEETQLVKKENVEKPVIIEKKTETNNKVEEATVSSVGGDSMTEDMEQPAKRRRGRPRKIKIEESPVLPVSTDSMTEDMEQPAKRRRGRPRKIRPEEVHTIQPIVQPEPIKEPEPIKNTEPVQNIEPITNVEPVQEADTIANIEPIQEITPIMNTESVQESQPKPVQELENNIQPEPLNPLAYLEPIEPVKPVVQSEPQKAEPVIQNDTMQHLNPMQHVEPIQPFEPTTQPEQIQPIVQPVEKQETQKQPEQEAQTNNTTQPATPAVNNINLYDLSIDNEDNDSFEPYEPINNTKQTINQVNNENTNINANANVNTSASINPYNNANTNVNTNISGNTNLNADTDPTNYFEPMPLNNNLNNITNNPFGNNSINNNNNIPQDPYADMMEPTNYPENRLISNIPQEAQNKNTAIAGQGKVVAFVGTSKNGTSFMVNNLAQLMSQNGINTAIVDLTQNKNSYYMFTDNDSSKIKTATESLKQLSEGQTRGLVVRNNLTVFTALPGDSTNEQINANNVLKNVSNAFEVVLLDCDFKTNETYFENVSEIYLVQSMDAFTIQPLTKFLSELKVKNVLDENKIRIIINKYVKLKKLNSKMIVGGMSKYNEPAMTLQRDLFNPKKVTTITVPFDNETYIKYLESIAMCELSLNGYSKEVLECLEKLRNMIYPLVAGNGNLPNNNFGYSSGFNDNYNMNNNMGFANQPNQQQFTNNMNDTLNKMRRNNY